MESYIQETLFSQPLSMMLFAAVLFTGFLTSLTPCVYPMLPITVGIVGRYSRTKKQAFGCALSYVLGLALMYAGLGVLAAVSGKLFGSVASHPATLCVVGVLCLAMAAWMAGWLSLPVVTAGLNGHVRSSRFGVRYISLFFMGGVSGLVMAPCTSPVMGMLLMFVAAQNDLWAGGILMFGFALGMSCLLLVAGTFSGVLASLPRSGGWMNVVKVGLASLMFGAGGYLLWLAWRAV